MSLGRILGRILVWTVVAAVIGTGLYVLVAGKGDTPKAPAPVTLQRTPERTPVAPPPPMPAAVDPDASAPVEDIARDAAAAEEKIKRDQDAEIRAMPPAPPDMGMTDKEGIEKDTEEAAKAARKP